jgi:hypothetical protein
MNLFAVNGWIDTYSFVEWLTRVFIPATGASREHRVLLLIDSHATRFTYAAIQAADEHGVDVLPLPTNASHIMQPLDLGLFGPLKLFVEEQWTELLIQSEARWPWRAACCIPVSCMMLYIW